MVRRANGRTEDGYVQNGLPSPPVYLVIAGSILLDRVFLKWPEDFDIVAFILGQRIVQEWPNEIAREWSLILFILGY
jgi:hypothetical protein